MLAVVNMDKIILLCTLPCLFPEPHCSFFLFSCSLRAATADPPTAKLFSSILACLLVSVYLSSLLPPQTLG